ncbi:tetratricopeptide repeat protein [Ovoidimarina sediminis]|uniref:tetratricopeptide repeat protein n=1 Tax=Ovoidimarina sediminis TaxID=3079856 RepID=UPI00290FE37E|nr:tetratricopeptide repeat protein [Rhodophyticola sp. MJ-SS7]MDU8943764.1 tetratricopeptide repeat protein [Rhodophyticola sp. MJ-SS7]
MQTDIFRQETTLASSMALAAWNDTQMAFLAHGAVTPEHLARTLEAEPGFALGHAVKGLFLMLLGRGELVPTAAEALQAAENAVRDGAVSAREHAFVLALGEWLSGRPSLAVHRLDEVLSKNPGDTLAMKLSHAIRFVLGDAAGMRRSIETVLPAYDADHPGRGYLLGCHAFALEETGEYQEAARAGRAGLELAADDAWGLHAVAHVYDMTGDSRGGIDWLSGREAAWAHCNNFRFHVWWHKALMHLDLGETETVLSLYDTLIRAERTDDYRDISNATSLLMRLELEGVDVGARWNELADLSAARTEDGSLVFADLHYLLALIGDRREDAVIKLLRRLKDDADRSASEADARMAHPGVAAATGLRDFGEGAYRTAFTHLARARRQMHLAGGSHAQRDIFERLTIDAGLRAGMLEQTEAILNDRTARRARTDDAYAMTRRAMIEAARRGSARSNRVPAE